MDHRYAHHARVAGSKAGGHTSATVCLADSLVGQGALVLGRQAKMRLKRTLGKLYMQPFMA